MKDSLFLNITGLIALGVMVASSALAQTQDRNYKKILFIGDSITSHGPKEELAWSGTWGMAASSAEKDYAHLFVAKVEAAQNGVKPVFLITAQGGGTLVNAVNCVDQFKAYQADLAVIQLGENDRSDITEEGFQAPYERILSSIKEGNPKAAILCCGVWSPPSGNPVKDEFIRKASKKYNAYFVDTLAINQTSINKAGMEYPGRYSHPGVAWHPGDKGMQAYADALWRTLQNPTAPAAAALSSTASAPFSIEENWDGKSQLHWNPSPTIEEIQGKWILKLVAEDANGSINIIAPLPNEKCKGKRLLITTRVRGENISDKPLPHNGIKFMFPTLNAEGVKDYPQKPLPTGTFDWKDVSWTVVLPDNIVNAKLAIGLEKVSGTVWFDTIKITEQ